MSKRIEQIVEVIEEVRKEFRSVKDMRIDAVAVVADRRGIERPTVADKYIRQLRPDIKRTADFDKRLEDYLVHDSDELRNILLKNRIDSEDVELINNAFLQSP